MNLVNEYFILESETKVIPELPELPIYKTEKIWDEDFAGKTLKEIVECAKNKGVDFSLVELIPSGYEDEETILVRETVVNPNYANKFSAYIKTLNGLLVTFAEIKNAYDFPNRKTKREVTNILRQDRKEYE